MALKTSIKKVSHWNKQQTHRTNPNILLITFLETIYNITGAQFKYYLDSKIQYLNYLGADN